LILRLLLTNDSVIIDSSSSELVLLLLLDDGDSSYTMCSDSASASGVCSVTRHVSNYSCLSPISSFQRSLFVSAELSFVRAKMP